MKPYCILFFVLLLVGCATTEKGTQTPVSSVAQLAASARLPIDSAVRKGQLENGLTYIIRENGRPENRAELRLVVNAGSILEDTDQQGLAHFVEHMAFNGTEHFPKQELVDFLEGIGMRFGADINAYTSFDETVYKLQVPTDSVEVVQKAFQILGDWAHRVSFEAEEIDKERGVVVDEWRTTVNPSEPMNAYARQTIAHLIERFTVCQPVGHRSKSAAGHVSARIAQKVLQRMVSTRSHVGHCGGRLRPRRNRSLDSRYVF